MEQATYVYYILQYRHAQRVLALNTHYIFPLI